MTLNRRDLLFGLGGGAAGLALTPVPWKLLDDVSIWTQHRRALPVPPGGEVSFSPAACTLCPAGCALRVRRVGPRPVSASGEARHPLGGGACAIGLTLHQLAYHPLRLPAPARRAGARLEPIAREAAVAAIVSGVRAAARAGQSVLVLDRRPGRVVSQAWCELLAGVPGGVYATVPGEDATLAALQGALAEPSPLGVDLEHARTVLSFGAPLLDGWGRPGRMLEARSRLRVRAGRHLALAERGARGRVDRSRAAVRGPALAGARARRPPPRARARRRGRPPCAGAVRPGDGRCAHRDRGHSHRGARPLARRRRARHCARGRRARQRTALGRHGEGDRAARRGARQRGPRRRVPAPASPAGPRRRRRGRDARLAARAAGRLRAGGHPRRGRRRPLAALVARSRAR